MRIFEPHTPTGDIAADVEHVIERALHATDGCPRHVVVEMILHRLGGAGYGLTRRQDVLAATAPVSFQIEEPVAPETEEQPAQRHIGTLIPWGDEDPDADPILPEDIIPDGDTGRILVTSDGLAYIGLIPFCTARKWLKLSGLKGLQHDLADVEQWLSDQISLPVRVTKLCKEDLSRALRGIQGYRAEVLRRDQEPTLSLQAAAQALKSAMALEKASNQIGWAEVERLTGLRPVPRAGRPL